MAIEHNLADQHALIAAREKEPWLLAASPSLDTLSAAEIVTLYARRIQIEQSFRDLKSHRYGYAFEDTLTRTPKRLEMLLLIHALASLAAWLAGLAATANTVAQVCAPSLTTRYSALWISWACLRQGRLRLGEPIAHALAQLRELLVHVA